MSIYQQKSGFLSVKPAIWEYGSRLHVRTSLVLQALGLGCYARHVIVDASRRVITISTRYLWFLGSRSEIPFDRVHHVDYDFGSLPTAWSWWHGTTDQVESFTVSVVVDDRDTVPIAAFRGEGSRMTGLGGMIFSGDSMVDFAGRQEDDSRAFCARLREILDVPLGRPVAPIADRAGNLYACGTCGRNSPPKRTKCQYCGGGVARVTP